MQLVTRILALLLPALLIPQVAAAVNGAVFADLPSCALSCLVASLADSSCSVTNTTCMCLDAKLQDSSETCIIANCTILEALSAKNITAIGCDLPVRDKSGVFRATNNTLAILSGVFLLARLAYRILVVGNIGADDWLCVAALLVGVPSSAMLVQGLAANGLGRDVWTLPTANIYLFIEFFYIIEILYFSDVALLKLTLLFFYLRIFPSQGVRRVFWGTIAFVTVYGIIFVFMGIFQCTPISYYWTNWDGEHTGHCLNVNSIGWANASISIALDFWMLAIPLWQLRSLRLHWKKKISVALMFVVGTFVTIVSILRLQSLLNFANSTNPTWDNYEVINWSTIEINVGIICACLPSARLILVHFFPRVLGSSQHSYNQYYNNSAGGPNGNSQANHSSSRAAAGGGGRSIQLVPTSSRHHPKGTTNTTITTINAGDEEDDIGTVGLHDGSGRFGRSNSNTTKQQQQHSGGAAAHQQHYPNGESDSGAGTGASGIVYSKSYVVEYGSDYTDEARLVYEQALQGSSSKSDLKSSRGSESSL